MMIDFLIDDVRETLIREGSEYLYTFPTQPHIFVDECKRDDRCMDKIHTLKSFEYRFGCALMIIRICTICLYGENEVFPPKQNRMVVNH